MLLLEIGNVMSYLNSYLLNILLQLIWIETPTNPTLKVNDIKAISEICKKHKLILVVDNSFLTPYFQRPLELGADMVIYSLTKFMNGHSDVVMGAVITSDESLHTQLRFLQNGKYSLMMYIKIMLLYTSITVKSILNSFENNYIFI